MVDDSSSRQRSGPAAGTSILEQLEGQLRGWLKRILLNVILNEARRLRSQSRQTDREVPADPRSLRDGGSSVSASLLRSELRDVLETALDRLKPEYAAVIRLRDFHEMEYAQIGEQLGKSAEAVRKVWNRAIAALQLELTNYVRDPR
jgi:RNA polymerase sigma-70 factor, ECF subfamily